MKTIAIVISAVSSISIVNATPVVDAPVVPAEKAGEPAKYAETIAWLEKDSNLEALDKDADKASELARRMTGDHMLMRMLAAKAKSLGMDYDAACLAEAADQCAVARQAATELVEACQKLAMWCGEWYIATHVGNDTFNQVYILESAKLELQRRAACKERLGKFEAFYTSHESALHECISRIK